MWRNNCREVNNKFKKFACFDFIQICISISYKNYEALLFSTPSSTLPPPSTECVSPSKYSISDSVLQ